MGHQLNEQFRSVIIKKETQTTYKSILYQCHSLLLQGHLLICYMASKGKFYQHPSKYYMLLLKICHHQVVNKCASLVSLTTSTQLHKYYDPYTFRSTTSANNLLCTQALSLSLFICPCALPSSIPVHSTHLSLCTNLIYSCALTSSILMHFPYLSSCTHLIYLCALT